MATPFYSRLKKYFESVAMVLRGEAEAASVFPNPTDIGQSRERAYSEFIRLHAPSKCNVFFGGYLFHQDGSESRQIDIIVTTDTAPRYDLLNASGDGKSFSPVEGTLGVVSVKSTLDKAQLLDSLWGFASIPPTMPLDGRTNPLLTIRGYEDWPYKVVYASNGIAGATLLQHLQEFYAEHEDIPIARRPNLIHVAGQHVISRIGPGMSLRSGTTGEVEEVPVGEFRLMTASPDIQAMLWVLHELQQHASASTHINYAYGQVLNGVLSAS